MLSTKTLEELYSEHDGYASDKWGIYLTVYERLFNSLKNAPVRLLEIGVQNGGSLAIWNKYFLQAERIIGCDINPACAQLAYDNGKTQVVIGDINHSDTQHKIFERCDEFDIIIDDGSHTSKDIIKTFSTLFPHIKQGGFYIVEDLHCSYWAKYQGGLYYPRSSMAFFKTLADTLNFEHWGLPSSREQLLKPFGITAELNEELLAEIHSVEFVNSMCILTRSPAEQNRLGRRHIAGRQELVCPIRQVDGTFSKAPPQQIGTLTETQPVLSQELEEVSELLQARLERKDQQITALQEQVRTLEMAQHQAHEQLVRAESQLDLLKELVLSSGRIEPL